MKIVRNYLYNASYQVLLILLPLITGPYVSRILGPTGVGINSYTYSIANWYVLLGSIGVGLYGNRQIAYVRSNEKDLALNFWEIFFMKATVVIIFFAFYIVYVVKFGKYKKFELAQSVYLVAALFDISWFFMGVEDFKRTVTRNTIVKIISLILILIFVKSKSDLLLYIYILSFATFGGNLTLWPYLNRYIHKIEISKLHPWRHFKGSIELFLPLAAIQIYTTLNKVMLGYFDSATSTGFYDKSDSIVRMSLTIVTSLGTVLLPHISKMIAEGETKRVNQLLYKSFSFTSFLSIPIMFGLAAISIKFAPFFYGDGFETVGYALFIESFVIIFIAWASVTGNQFLIPAGLVKPYTFSIIIGAIANLLLNIPLIKLWGLFGAIVATLVSEVSVTTYQIYSIRKFVSYKKLFHDTGKYITAGIIMFTLVFLLNIKLKMDFVTLLVEIIIGVLVYLIMSLLLRPDIISKIMLFIKENFGVKK
ncbi:polysaccharide biosynthesis C-terminal domain-containing protein [Limosilactobacillus mucosae]